MGILDNFFKTSRPSVYTPAGASPERQEEIRADIKEQFKNAWELVKNPVAQPKPQAIDPDNFEASTAAEKSRMEKASEKWTAYTQEVNGNKFFAFVQREYSKQLASMDTSTPDKAESSRKKAAEIIEGKLDGWKKGATDAAFSKGNEVIKGPAISMDFKEVGAAASHAFGYSLMTGNAKGAFGNAYAAAKGNMFTSVVGSIMNWVKSIGKDILMWTGGAEHAKAFMHTNPEWMGGGGHKEKITPEQAKKLLQEQQTNQRLMDEGFIPRPAQQQQATPNQPTGSDAPAQTTQINVPKMDGVRQDQQFTAYNGALPNAPGQTPAVSSGAATRNVSLS